MDNHHRERDIYVYRYSLCYVGYDRIVSVQFRRENFVHIVKNVHHDIIIRK